MRLQLNEGGSHVLRRKVWKGHQLSNKKELVPLIRVWGGESKLNDLSIHPLEPVKNTPLDDGVWESLSDSLPRS